MTRTTVVYSPHPDDETLRLTAYALFAANQRGDNMILVAVTDGGATGVRHRLGLTERQTEIARAAEQSAAWAYLTGGRGEVVRLGIKDGQVNTASNRRRISDTARQFEQSIGSANVEHYVAAHPTDGHSDHLAVVRAVSESGARVVRYARAADQVGGTKYDVAASDRWSAGRATEVYKEIGQTSVPTEFDALRARNYGSYITS